MPELPEVERVVRLLNQLAKGKRLADVETFEDSIVFSGITHNEFGSDVKGRVVLDAKRYGKVFYLELDGQGRHPVLHFGMTGMLQVRGQLPMYYREVPKSALSTHMQWPPRFVKFIFHLLDEEANETTEIAFLDARRLGRIRLCESPKADPPISQLGFDPILTMPPLEAFTTSVKRRSCPIKALLLDQSFSAGVGNWVADEILYNAAIHPEQRCNTLTADQLDNLHKNIRYVCETAIAVNADDDLFPKHWLFQHRWGKNRKPKETLLPPSGETATIKWITVGGRTSAYVTEVQTLPRANESNSGVKSKVEDDHESDLSQLIDSQCGSPLPTTSKISRKRKIPQTLIGITPKEGNEIERQVKAKKA